MYNGLHWNPVQEVQLMTYSILAFIIDRYILRFEHIVGDNFFKADTEDVAARIEKNVSGFLKSRK